MIRALLVPALLLCHALPTPAADPLTIGSTAPKLGLESFLIGEPVKEIQKGTIYVVEFSGTQCAPCIKCMPELTALQKKHKDIVFISVYAHEKKEEVTEFLTKHRDKIGYRVAIDPEGNVDAAWSDAALRTGIPDAFIVGLDARIAWIGNPAEMADPLAQIVAGTFNPRPDILRLKILQGATARERHTAERERKAGAEYDRINAQVIKGELEAAMKATEAALKEYADAPRNVHLFSGMKLYLMAKQPGRKGAALEYGVELAVAAKVSRDELTCRSLADTLLNAGDADVPTERNFELIDLGIIVLNDLDGCLETYLRNSSKSIVGLKRIYLYQQLGYAHHLRGNGREAVRHIGEAITLVKAFESVPGNESLLPKESREKTLRYLTADLEKYKKEPQKPLKEKK